MLEYTPAVVDVAAAPSWKFALRVLWESAFRIGDLMDFSWNDERHIHPVWPTHARQFATIIVPSIQTNGKSQEIPFLPGLQRLLEEVPENDRTGWVANPLPPGRVQKEGIFRLLQNDLASLVRQYSNQAIARTCGVTETAVRNWLHEGRIGRGREFMSASEAIPEQVVFACRQRAEQMLISGKCETGSGLTKDFISRVISRIGEAAGVVVRQEDERTGQQRKFASAHDLRRRCAYRLINAGVSAETLKLVLRHRDFTTTEKFYGATRSTQAAAQEIYVRLSSSAESHSLVGGFMGGNKRSSTAVCRRASQAKGFAEFALAKYTLQGSNLKPSVP